MASLNDLPSKHRVFVRTYRWRRIDPIPFSPLRKSLSEARVGLVSTAALSTSEEPFDPGIRGGDFSFREIPFDLDPSELVESHRSDAWDHTGVEEDRNLAVPLDPLRELQSEGVIGAVNQRHLSFMGSITAPGRLIRRTAPQAAELFLSDGVDVALLVPV